MAGAWSSGPGLSASFASAAAAGDGLNLLYLAPDLVIKYGVDQEDQPVRAGVGVVLLDSFAWTKYARLFGVHS